MVATDNFYSETVTMASPPSHIEAVTCSDTADSGDLAVVCRGFMVTSAGDVAVVMADGSTGIYPGCLVGVIYPGRIKRFAITGTANTTGIKALS